MCASMKIHVIYFHGIYFSDKLIYPSTSDSIRAAEIEVTSIDSPILKELFVGPAQIIFILLLSLEELPFSPFVIGHDRFSV